MRAALIDRLALCSDLFELIAKDEQGWPAISWHWFQRGDPFPAIALSKISPGEEWTHDGPDGLDRPRVRFDLRGTDADQLELLSAALKAEMRIEREISGWRFHPATLEADREIPLGEQDGGEALIQLQLEFMFYIEEID